MRQLNYTSRMQITLYMATTVNGLVARLNGETDFISEAEWSLFQAAAKQAGWIVVGRKTYEVMRQANDLSKLNGLGIVVVTGSASYAVAAPDHLVAASPQDALELLSQRGAERALVAGGSTLNAAFMGARLVDELQLDIEPTALGLGLPFFNGANFEVRLELLGVERFATDGVRLRYRVAGR